MITITKIISRGLLISMLLAAASADAAVVRRFGDTPLNDIIAAAQADPKCSGLTSGELAVMMLAPVWWETVGGSSTVTPSPMTLSRGDYGLKNKRLYSFVTYAKEDRAFSHPGVGLWQLDDAGLGQSYAAHQRINTQSSSRVAAQHVAFRYCNNSGEPLQRRKKAWSDWYACDGANFQRCEDTYQNHYNAASDSIVNVTRDATISRTGGMISRFCRYADQATLFVCYYIAASKAEGHKGSWQGLPLTGGKDSQGVSDGSSPSPLALPFYNYLRTPTGAIIPTEYRHWIVADTIYTRGEIHARRRKGTDARMNNGYNGWVDKDWLCDDTLDRGTCVP
jgi:hypothetical protein